MPDPTGVHSSGGTGRSDDDARPDAAHEAALAGRLAAAAQLSPGRWLAPRGRRDVLAAAARSLLERVEELTSAQVAAGVPVSAARGEVARAAERLGAGAALAAEQDWSSPHRPRGVVAATLGGSALVDAATTVAAAVALGCPLLLPVGAEQVTVVGALVREVLRHGLPGPALHCEQLPDPAAALAALAVRPGCAVALPAPPPGAPLVVLSSSPGLAASIARRCLLHPALADRAVGTVVAPSHLAQDLAFELQAALAALPAGEPEDPATQVVLPTGEAAARAAGAIDDAVADGALQLGGGLREGALHPTVLLDPAPLGGTRPVKGPVVTVVPAASLEHALGLVGTEPRPLAWLSADDGSARDTLGAARLLPADVVVVGNGDIPAHVAVRAGMRRMGRWQELVLPQ